MVLHHDWYCAIEPREYFTSVRIATRVAFNTELYFESGQYRDGRVPTRGVILLAAYATETDISSRLSPSARVSYIVRNIASYRMNESQQGTWMKILTDILFVKSALRELE
jgi:hypothetical protein